MVESAWELQRHAKQSHHFFIAHLTIKNPPFHFAEHGLTGILNAHFLSSAGNRPYNLDCGNGAVTVGRIYKTGMGLDVLGIICQHGNPQNGTLENEFTRGPVREVGANALNSHCPVGQVE